MTTVHSPLAWIVKPVLMPALLLWLALSVRGSTAPDLRIGGVFAALVFSTLGDVFLIPGGKVFFPLGLAAFGLTHVCYVASFVRLRFLREALSWELVGLLPFGAYAYLLGSLVWERIPPELAAPFAVYMALVLSTGLAAFVRLLARRDRAAASILCGAVLFIQSDSLIAVNRFATKLPFAELAVMATYLAGQLLIARGVEASCSRQDSHLRPRR